MSWWWIGALLIGLLVVAMVVSSARRMRRLYSDESVQALLMGLSSVKAEALEKGGARVITSAPATVVYTLSKDGGVVVVHHLSFSTPLTPASAAGTYFLALLRIGLDLPKGELDVFVSQNRVFHLEVRVEAGVHEAWAEAPAPDLAGRLGEVRSAALMEQRVLLRGLQVRNVA